MHDKLIFADIDSIIRVHVEWLFNGYDRKDQEDIVEYIHEHLLCVFKCDFLPKCNLCGLDWSETLLSGIKYWLPEVYDAMPDDDYSAYELAMIIDDWYLIAELPELCVSAAFDVLNLDVHDISLFHDFYCWLYDDANYSPRW